MYVMYVCMYACMYAPMTCTYVCSCKGIYIEHIQTRGNGSPHYLVELGVMVPLTTWLWL